MWRRMKSRRSREADLERELRAHVELEAEEQAAAGLPSEEAAYAARRALGNATQIQEDVRIAWGFQRLETLLRDFHFGLRQLRRNPGFAVLAVLSLALGIGGNAAIFSVVSAVLIRPLPYRDPGELIDIADYYPPGAIAAMQQWSRTMDLAAVSPDIQLNLTGEGQAARLVGSAVSANLFSVLGTGAALGRTFRSGEDSPGEDRLVILSHALWQERFGGDPGVIGKQILLGGISRRVVGVMAADFMFPDSTARFWIPLRLDPRDANNYWGANFTPIIGRLRPGATPQAAQKEIRRMTARVRPLFPYPMGRDWNSDATVIPLQSSLTGGLRRRLILLQCAIGLVLLIACVNVASLLLARATSRQKEMALRAALGAAPGRIVQQLLTESMVLGLTGGALGLALAYVAFSELKRMLPATTAHWSGVHLGWPVLAFVAALSLATGLAFGLAPALACRRPNLSGTLKTGGQRSAGGGARLRGALIAGEVALAVVLAIGAGLLIKSLWLLNGVNPGFQPQRVVVLRVSPNESLCQKREACIALYNELLDRTRQIPGVTGAAASNAVPLGGEFTALAPVDLEGHPRNPKQNVAPLLWAGAVTPGYFHALQIPILSGRGFRDSDTGQSTPVVIVSAATARRYWPGQNPIGKHLRPVWDTPWRTVVGVAGDVRQYDLAGRAPNTVSGAFYMPYPQSTNIQMRLPASMMLIVRTAVDPAQIVSSVQELVRDLNPNVPVSEVQTMESLVEASTQQSRSMVWFFACFAGVALLLAAIGAYGVVSYSTAQRTFEIGIRMAVGATRGQIFAMILRQSLRLVLVGLAIGIVISLAISRALAAFLYGVGTTDPLTYCIVCGLLIGIALVAGFVPARKAASVNPLKALRTE